MKIYSWSLIKGAFYQVPSEVRRNLGGSAYREKNIAIDGYNRVFSHDVTAAMLVFQNK